MIRELDAGFSPAAISHRIRIEEMVIATDTIYEAVYAGFRRPVSGRTAENPPRTTPFQS